MSVPAASPRSPLLLALLGCLLGCLLAGLLSLPLTVPATSSAATASTPGRTVTLEGTYLRMSAVGEAGEHVLHALRTERRTLWLDLADLHPPAPGTHVAVEGQLAAGTVTATSLRAFPDARRLTAAAAAPRSDRLLVMRAYWGATRPGRPSAAAARSAFVGQGRSWFEEVSHGRYTVSGTVTSWLRIKRPSDCTGSAHTSMDRTKAAARRAGHRLAAYSRYLLYLPCDGGGMLGLGSLPGRHVWLFGSTRYDVAVHEQGHNLGLEHAHARECRSGGDPVTWSSRCASIPYGDPFDVMGNRGGGHLQAVYKEQLGWLQDLAVLGSDATRTLAPYETTGPGLKALRVRTGELRAYWLEYRTRYGRDAAFAPGAHGVVLRVRAGTAEPELLDLMPGSGTGFAGGRAYTEWERTRLPARSSWTSPEGIRFTTVAEGSTGARVTVDYAAPAPAAPDAPPSVTARPTVGGARVTWARPLDNGSIITGYQLTARTPGLAATTVRVDTVGGLVRRAVLDGLDPSRSYTVAVRARNRVGTSAGTRSAAVTPLAPGPVARITAPADGDVALAGEAVPVSVEVHPNAETGSAVEEVTLLVDGSAVDTSRTAPYTPTWETTGWPPGSHTLRVVADDADGQRGRSAPVVVTLEAPTPTG